MKKIPSTTPPALSVVADNPLTQRFQILIHSLTVIGFGMLAAAGQLPAPIGFRVSGSLCSPLPSEFPNSIST